MSTGKERPILFSSEMVREILDGRKTQTRRVMKPQPDRVVSGLERRITAAGNWLWGNRIGSLIEATSRKCPYGQPGDLLWVRETWQTWQVFDDIKPTQMPAEKMKHGINYLASDKAWDSKVRPSIFMPRWASRITLRVKNVRVERVQDISEDDIWAEGIDPVTVDSGGFTPWGESIDIQDYHRPFIDLWDSINAKRGYSWESNPWVWVVEFEVVE